MKLPMWKEGRQGSGYQVLTLINNQFFKFDLHILKYPEGSQIHPHRDPAKKGFKHYRLNVVLRAGESGGHFWCKSPIFKTKRIALFRPDIDTHHVTTVFKGTRYVLSIGWLKKSP